MKNNSVDVLITRASTSASMLRKACRVYGIPLNGIRSIYDMPSNMKSGAYIFLIAPDRHSDGHWVSLFRKGRRAIYFDPYGVGPPSAVVGFANRSNCQLLFSTDEIQDLRTEHCGSFVIQWLRHMSIPEVSLLEAHTQAMSEYLSMV